VAGSGTALYFRWDESAGKAELGIGSPVEGVSQVNDPELSLVSVAESKAAKLTVRGGYEQLRGAHAKLAQYIQADNLKPTLTLEEYAVMGTDNPDPKAWETNLYYLHE
jgi:effector-binding domain-containing protein